MDLIANNVVLTIVLSLVAAAIGWTAAQLVQRKQIEQVEAAVRARTESQHQRAIDRLRKSNTDLENQAKDLMEKLSRRDRLLRDLQTDLDAAREQMRQLVTSGSMPISAPAHTTSFTPSKFQDPVLDEGFAREQRPVAAVK